MIVIVVRASFARAARQNATISIGAYNMPNLMNVNNQISIQPNTTVSGFIQGKNNVQVFRTLLMDTNSTYRFTLLNTFGLMALMVDHNNATGASPLKINDDQSYDFASASIDFGEVQNVVVN